MRERALFPVRLDLFAYLALAVANVAIGYPYIHIIPPQLGGDTAQYVQTAQALLGTPSGEFYYYRSWGYPLFLILTGFPGSNNPEPVLIAQLVLGSTIPFLIGSSVEQLGVSRWLSVSCAALCFVSLSPLILAGSMLSDQVSQVLLYFVIWLLASAMTRTQHPWRYGLSIGAVFFVLALMHPANSLLGLLALTALLVSAKAPRKLALSAVASLLMLTALWMPAQKAWIARSEATIGRVYNHTDGSLAGAMFFWNIYASGSIIAGRPTITGDNGTCSRELQSSLERGIGETNKVLPPAEVTPTDVVLNKPTLMHHLVIWKSLENDLGAKAMDGVFWCAALEGVFAEPKALLFFYDGMLSYFLASDVIYNNGYRQAWPSIEQYAASIPTGYGAWALYVGSAIKIAAFFVAVLTLVPTLLSSNRTFVIVLWTMMLYLAAIHVVFAAPHWRYSLTAIPGLVLLSGLGLSETLKLKSVLSRLSTSHISLYRLW
jgi:hypothetical protein